MIEKLLLLARADANVAQFHLEPLSLYPVLQRVAQNAKVLAAGKGIVFSETVLPYHHTLLGDEAALERLFLSILDNALKYTPPGGRVSLELRLENGQAIVEVADTGIGIDAKDLPHVFERFYRADQSRSREVRGSGLGLSIAKWIAEIHGGAIEANSQPLQGSRFVVHLPLAEHLEGGQEPQPGPLRVREESLRT